RASISRQNGSCALHFTQEPPRALQITSAVPSPPSAIGTISIFASGSASRSPLAMFSAASRAFSAPLNLSGAIKIFMVHWAGERRNEKFSIDNRHSKMELLPLDGARRFAGDVVTDAVNAFDFVADATRNACQQFVRNPDPVGGHAVLTFHNAKHNGVFVGSLVAHNAD